MLRFIIIICISCTFNLSAQIIDNYFTHITKQHGLSSNSITSICQDSKGFMWFGTQDGLNRLDGYEFVVFRTKPNVVSSICYNSIKHLIYFDSTKLLVGTLNGLNILDLETYQFSFFKSKYKADTLLKFADINCFLRDSQNNFWVGTNTKGLWKYIPGENNFIHFLYDPEKSKAENRIISLYEDQQGKIYVAQPNKLGFLSSGKDSLEIIFSGDDVNAIHKDSKGNLWLGTHNMGLYISRKNQEKILPYHINLNVKKTTYSVSSIFEDTNKNLFITLTNNGLVAINIETEKQQLISYDEYNKNSLNSIALTCSYIDNANNIWIGTYDDGINFYDVHHKKFKHYYKNFAANGLFNNNVRSIYQDKQGDIWIGTNQRGGLSKFNPENGTFKNYPYNPNSPY